MLGEPRACKARIGIASCVALGNCTNERDSGIFTWQGAHNVIRYSPKARQCCNPPQSVFCPAEHA
eukprot:13730739-Alexandrium_andersonii.AAC.1